MKYVPCMIKYTIPFLSLIWFDLTTENLQIMENRFICSWITIMKNKLISCKTNTTYINWNLTYNALLSTHFNVYRYEKSYTT